MLCADLSFAEFLQHTHENYQYATPSTSAQAKINIFTLNEGDATAIANILAQKNGTKAGTYTIDGRKVSSSDMLQPGLYISNGMKQVRHTFLQVRQIQVNSPSADLSSLTILTTST